MQAVTDNKINKIIFYFIIFIFLTTIHFLEKAKNNNKKRIFSLNKIEIFGYEKIDHEILQSELSSFLGQNLLLIKRKDFKDIMKKHDLIKEFTITKRYPNEIYIKLKEVNFVAILIKDKKKYILADNNNLIPFEKSLINLGI